MPPCETIDESHDDCCGLTQHFEWYSTSLQFLLNFTQGTSALHPECVTANQASPWKCLYANETLAHTKAPVFAIQQLSSVWDNQCVFNGQQMGNILQVSQQ